MRIACLQFAPKLGAVKENMDKADSILASTADLKVPEDRQADSRHLWLVLPEMAFSGKLKSIKDNGGWTHRIHRI